MPRLYGDKEDINSVKVTDFFNKKQIKMLKVNLQLYFSKIQKNSEKAYVLCKR